MERGCGGRRRRRRRSKWRRRARKQITLELVELH